MVKVKEDLTGKQFGTLTVLEQVEDYISPQGRAYARWKCLCECGNEIFSITSNLKSGNTISCGCIRTKNKNTRLYRIWSGMKSRCYNPNATHYNEYGGRGIIICEEWKNNFLVFKEWAIKNGYSDELTIDRKDNNGNYCPSNCQWITMKKQSNNRRNNFVIEYNGEKHTLSEWSDITGIKVITLWDRINLLGWTIERTLTTKNANEKILTYNNELHNIKQWSDILHISYNTLKRKLQKGMSLKDIVEY